MEISSEQARWNDRYAAADPARRAVGQLLVEHAEHLPTSGSALDIAGGDGIEACWLAQRGLHTSLLDVSDVALGQARDLASAQGVRLETLHVDLDQAPLPVGPWDVIHLAHFLDRQVMAAAVQAVAGVLLLAIATEANLERHDRPPRNFLLDAGELADFADRHTTTLEVIRCDEAWRRNGNHEAWLVARRRPPISR